MDARYHGWTTSLGQEIESGKLDLAALEKWVLHKGGEPKKLSFRLKHFMFYSVIVDRYLASKNYLRVL